LKSLSLHRPSSLSRAPYRPSGEVCPGTSLSFRLSSHIKLLFDCLPCSLFPSLFCTFLLTSVLFQPMIGWHALPLPPGPNGTGNRRHCCAGCLLSVSQTPDILRCSFSDRGFSTSDGSVLRPCKTAHHPSCISVGFPFTSRRRNHAGLCFPPVSDWPNFICELCTVRSVLHRELTGPNDWQLLCLERMRLVDMAHSWAHLRLTRAAWATALEPKCGLSTATVAVAGPTSPAAVFMGVVALEKQLPPRYMNTPVGVAAVRARRLTLSIANGLPVIKSSSLSIQCKSYGGGKGGKNGQSQTRNYLRASAQRQ
jgi:hypothetical protein